MIQQPFKVAALISGEPGAQELWTLRAMASVDCELHVVQALQSTTISKRKRVQRMINESGLAKTALRWAGSAIGSRVASRDHHVLNELFDFPELCEWWKNSGITPRKVKALNHKESQETLSSLRPDVIVRVSGGILKPQIFSLARLMTLNVHHGQAPLIRGMWSIPWGVIEGREDWIGASVHVIDEGIDTGMILWRGGPQLAPGDTTVDLFFRTHLEAIAALVKVLNEFASGNESPSGWPIPKGETSTYRSAASLWDWLRLLYLGRGRRAPVLISKGIEC